MMLTRVCIVTRIPYARSNVLYAYNGSATRHFYIGWVRTRIRDERYTVVDHMQCIHSPTVID
jgi:hypothetical protein